MSDQVTVAQLPPCDVCRSHGGSKLATVDGKTTMGPWANMCEQHFDALGVGLGLGKGQRLIPVGENKLEESPQEATGMPDETDQEA